MSTNVREFHCDHVSVSQAGDGFQVLFEKTPETDEEYVLVQRHFELPDGGECYVETEDPDFCGHYPIRNAQLSRNRFHMEFGNEPVKQVTVLFNATDSAYTEAKRVLQIMIPELQLA